MKPSSRVLLAGLIIELLLAGIGAYLIMQLKGGAITASTNVAGATATITSVLGMVMGALGGLTLTIYVVQKRRGS